MELSELDDLPKIDAHTHLIGQDRGPPAPGDGDLVAMLHQRRMRWLDLCWLDDEVSLRSQIELATIMHRRHPDRVAWATAFSLVSFGSPEWAESAAAQIDAGRAAGAVAVKVWKNIGMTLRDGDRYVMIDDPRIAPVLEHVERTGMTLAMHTGEPLNCWLPLESMTMEGDRSYYRAHPEYHGHLHPEVPAHAEQIRARDNVLARHPGLRVVGCHLASLEYDVGVVAGRLETYPNLAVDLAGRICHLQSQDRGKVREFFLAYRERILYGTDEGAHIGLGGPPEHLRRVADVYDRDARWLATDDVVEAPSVAPGYRCRGLALPDDVLRAVYHDNAVRWYPGLAGPGTTTAS